MVWPGQPQSPQERHWTNCQHDLHTSCQQHLGYSVKEWWVTDVLGNATICPFSKYIPCETIHLNGCHSDTFLLKNLNILNISMLLVAITKANGLKSVNAIKLSKLTGPSKVFKFSHIVWKQNAWWFFRRYTGKIVSGQLVQENIHNFFFSVDLFQILMYRLLLLVMIIHVLKIG